MRNAFSDELFVRSAGGLISTPYARTLVEPLASILLDAEKLFTRAQAFNPADARRSFILAVPDAAEVLIIPSVLSRLRVEAPNIQLQLRSVDPVEILGDLNTGRLDMAIGVFTDGQVHHKRKLLNNDGHLCLYNDRLLDLGSPIRLDRYLEASHLVLTGIDGPSDRVGEELAKQNLSRNVALSTTHLLSIPFLVQQTSVVATVHANLARYFAQMLGLRTADPPLRLPSVPISLLWHSSNDVDPAHQWLRSLLIEASAKLRLASQKGL